MTFRQLQCPNCGAPIAPKQGLQEIECAFCGSLLKVEGVQIEAGGSVPWGSLERNTALVARDVLRKRLEERVAELLAAKKRCQREAQQALSDHHTRMLAARRVKPATHLLILLIPLAITAVLMVLAIETTDAGLCWAPTVLTLGLIAFSFLHASMLRRRQRQIRAEIKQRYAEKLRQIDSQLADVRRRLGEVRAEIDRLSAMF